MPDKKRTPVGEYIEQMRLRRDPPPSWHGLAIRDDESDEWSEMQAIFTQMPAELQRVVLATARALVAEMLGDEVQPDAEETNNIPNGSGIPGAAPA